MTNVYEKTKEWSDMCRRGLVASVREGEEKTEIRKFGDEEIGVIFRKPRPKKEGTSMGWYRPPLDPGVTAEDGIIIERDAAVRLRDGTTIYTDIYRPEGAKNVPAIVAWAPYGKSWRRGQHVFPMLGVPDGVNSNMCIFEGPDPAYWCRYGYAVIGPDARGACNSEGDISFWGTSEASDCYDLIEWVAALDWCNGKIAMSGVSWLSNIQWPTAALRPPHLTCIAPWAGWIDLYRDMSCRGGIPEILFFDALYSMLSGPGFIEDVTAMVRKYPLMNGYWEDKIAKVENIEIPAYIAVNLNDTEVSALEAFRRMPSQNKWLRINLTQEWPDNYEPQNLEDLRRFFDRYLKGIRNGWEFTPRVRLSVYNPGGIDVVNRPENEWPLAREQHQKLFLDAATGGLSYKSVTKKSMAHYEANGKGEVTFTIRFEANTELVGYPKLRLWVEADGADDMDLFVSIQKLDQQGNILPIPYFDLPHQGKSGMLRVSHRELDEKRSTPSEPFLKHRRQQLLKPKEIVPVEIPLQPISMLWHAGQQMRVVVSDDVQHFGYLDWDIRKDRINRGKHIIHTGGEYDSHLLVPLILG